MHSNYIWWLPWVSRKYTRGNVYKKRFSIYTIKAAYHDYRLPQSQTFLLRSLKKKTLNSYRWVGGLIVDVWRVVLIKTSISCFLLLLSEWERQWKENNDFLKSQISKLRQQSADFKKDVLTRSNASSTFAEQASLRTFALTVSVHPGHVELRGPICQN